MHLHQHTLLECHEKYSGLSWGMTSDSNWQVIVDDGESFYTLKVDYFNGDVLDVWLL